MIYKKNDKTFSFLMHCLYMNKVFNELHLPSLNYILEEKNSLRIKKEVPLEFENRVNSIIKLITKSKLTNLKIINVKKEDKIFIDISTKKGKIFEDKDLTLPQKKK